MSDSKHRSEKFEAGLKTRILVNLNMITALNRADEFKLHSRGAFNNGDTKDKTREVLAEMTAES